MRVGGEGGGRAVVRNEVSFMNTAQNVSHLFTWDLQDSFKLGISNKGTKKGVVQGVSNEFRGLTRGSMGNVKSKGLPLLNILEVQDIIQDG